MNSRERILTTLDHREPDRVPFDLGSCQVTGIHVVAYRNLRKALGFPDGGIEFCDAVQQLASIDDDVVARMNIDTRGLYPLNSHNWKIIEEDAGDYWAYHDEWGITHHRPKDDGLYYSVVKVPLPRSELTVADISNHPWPDVANPERLAGLCDLARQYRDAGYAVVLKDAFAGIFEFAQRIVGMENLLVMMITNEKVTCALFDRLLQLKLDYWQTALAELGDLVDVVTYADDYGTQTSQLISPDMFRRLIKPRLKVLFETFIKYAPHAKRFFHSDGNVRPLIPDFLEIGVDILNPIHIRAQNMAPVGLKRDYGKDLAFWGGGVDTQGILPRGAPQEVKDDVRRNIEALAPGGGYVFNTIHNIQADVPPQNLIAMWEALQEYGVY
ncbi:MAG: uroporphyrinogen decarboxylase family protein [Desulfobacteraceae bacterium]|jgi:uroporphyrinogen decarboxylase|nr:uroporphyrinogen decarboxylase family protein [Desulfobacteraceae bacterium]